MSNTYAETNKRLISERERLALSVQQLSDLIYVDQSNWCKIEQGKGRISYKCMKNLCAADVDMYYVLTGKKKKYDNYNGLEEFEIPELVNLIKLMNSVAGLCYRKRQCELWKDICENTGYIWAVDTEADVKKFLVSLRKIKGYSQKEFAEILGMDIKKLQNMEKGARFPDNELICRLYDEFRVSPGILLEDRNCLINEVCCLLEKMVAADGGFVLDFWDLITKWFMNVKH